jgi:ketosteroid isomerase-like protein
MIQTPLDIVHACMKAYVDNDRSAIETLLDSDYHFTSPLDNALDRATYMAVCWPNSAAIASFDVVHEVERGPCVSIVYEGRTSSGRKFRNCEVHTVHGGKLVSTEVYFGWDVPHKVPLGTHRDPRS